MVAGTVHFPKSHTIDPVDRAAGGAVVRFTIDDVQAMIRERIIPEDASTELLDGLVVVKDRAARGEEITVHGTRHSLVVALLARLAARIDTPLRHVRSQLPLICDEINAPEPDAAVVRGVVRDYAQRLPSAPDAFCVVEVADSSYERDSEHKFAIYARASVPQYLIVNLRNDTVELYTEPESESAVYREKRVLKRDESLLLHVGADDSVSVLVDDILP
jgi:Uma2 family endonuclease